MATEVDWASVGGQNSGSKVDFIKFSAGKTVRIRPIGMAVEFCKFFIRTSSGNRSVCVDLENAEKARQILAEHTGNDEIAPQHRYAINVIDREDGEIKIMEGGSSIFKAFASWAKEAGTNPGGPGGSDWAIEVTGEGKLRRYQPNCIKPSVITADEKAKFIELVQERSIEDYFKGVPLDDLITKVFGDNPASGEAPQSGDSTSNDPIKW